MFYVPLKDITTINKNYQFLLTKAIRNENACLRWDNSSLPNMFEYSMQKVIGHFVREAYRLLGSIKILMVFDKLKIKNMLEQQNKLNRIYFLSE